MQRQITPLNHVPRCVNQLGDIATGGQRDAGVTAEVAHGLTRAPDGMTQLTARSTGTIWIQFAVTATRALEAIAGTQPESCP